jgi:hypothetical protein
MNRHWLLGIAAGMATQAWGQDKPPKPLADYLVGTEYTKPGAPSLLGIDLGKVYSNEDHPNSLLDYGRKIDRLGRENVICLEQTFVLDESLLSNAYDRLSLEEKLNYLLATLSAGDLMKLNGEGLCPDDLSGQQRAALISMFPHPFNYLPAVVQGGGLHSDSNWLTVPDTQLGQVKLQMFKGVNVEFGRAPNPPGSGYRASVISSLGYNGPEGTRVMMTARQFGSGGPKTYGPAGAEEKKSQINWGRRELSASIQPPGKCSVADAVKLVRDASGLEVWVDRRVASREVDFYGQAVTAGEYLRSICLALNGAIRQVGSVFLLAPNVEGEAAREVRVRTKLVQEDMAISAEIAKWHAAVASRGILQRLGFSPQDPFQAGSIPSENFADPAKSTDSMWTPLTQLSPQVADAISQQSARSGQASYAPDPAFADKVLIRSSWNYRFVLPDGAPLEFRPYYFNANTPSVVYGRPLPELPFDMSVAKDGTAVGYRSDDAAAVGRLCALLKHFKVSELWLESRSSGAVQAAIDSGLKVDLVLRPWRPLKAEPCPEPDLDPAGITGSELDKIPEAKMDPSGEYVSDFYDSFSLGANLSDHIQGLLSFIPKKGLNRLVLMDSIPTGYQPASAQQRGGGFGRDHPNLPAFVPGLFEFGYTNRLRADFIRKNGIDPVDLTDAGGENLCPAPYFDEMPFSQPMARLAIDFPQGERIDYSLVFQWRKEHAELADAALSQLLPALYSLSYPVYADTKQDPQFGIPFGPSRGFSKKDPAVDLPPNQTLYVMRDTICPLTYEDSQGNITYKLHASPADIPICFDLSGVPEGQLNAYMHYLFKAP